MENNQRPDIVKECASATSLNISPEGPTQGIAESNLRMSGDVGPGQCVDLMQKEALWFVEPELRAAAREVKEIWAGHTFDQASLPGLRGLIESWNSEPRTDVLYLERVIPGASGHPEVSIYVVNPKPGVPRGAILHIHGGGTIAGSAKGAVRQLQEIATALDCVIVTVEYRLSPETHYIGATEDNYAALKWLYDNSDELGADRQRIVLMGESAGGGNAARVAILARDRGEVAIKFQCLTYPMLDDRTGSTRDVPDHIGTLVWTREANRFGWASFLGQEPGGLSVPSAAVPARVDDLSGLPATWIGVGGIDLFVDEDIEYAKRLINAGVPTELLVVPGAFHGFDLFASDTTVSRRFDAARLDALRRVFAG